MLDKNMNDHLNAQIQAELYSAYLYLAMAAWCDEESWKGSAHWFRKQAEEEVKHAMKFYHYIVEKGGRAVMEAIQKPPVVTKRIHDLVALAREMKDYATEQMLQWFVAEQVEEEAQTLEIVQKLRKVSSSNCGMLYLDGKLAKRE